MGEGRIEFEEVPRPEPGPGEVLVEITACGICGSDLHMVLERYARPGSILGHEWSGVVAAAPSDSGWAPGDRVVGNAAAGMRRLPALSEGTTVGVPAPRLGGLRWVSRCVLPLQDGGRRRPDPDARCIGDAAGGAGRADGDHPARAAAGRRAPGRSRPRHRGRAGRVS